MEFIRVFTTWLDASRIWIWMLLSGTILFLLIQTKKRWGSASQLFFLGAVLFLLGWLVSLYPVSALTWGVQWIPYTLLLLLTLRYQLRLTTMLPSYRNWVLPQLFWLLLLLLGTIAKLWLA